MASLSGIVKTILNLEGGDPKEEDYFIFGQSELKKVSWKNMKALIKSRTNLAIETHIGVNVNVFQRCGVVFFRMGGYIQAPFSMSYEQLCTLPEEYRPVSLMTLAFTESIAQSTGFYLQIGTDGVVKIRGSKEFKKGDAVNAMFTYLT